MILQLAQLNEFRKQNSSKTIVLLGGVFDIIHPGHIDYLEAARRIADIVVVAVCPDKQVRVLKGTGRPVQEEGSRMKILSKLAMVDAVVLGETTDDKDASGIAVMPIVKMLRPDYLLTINKKDNSALRQLKELGVELVVLDIVKLDSSTEILRRLDTAYGSK